MDWLEIGWIVLIWLQAMLIFAAAWQYTRRGTPLARLLGAYAVFFLRALAWFALSAIAVRLLPRWEPWGTWLAIALGVAWVLYLISQASELLVVSAVQRYKAQPDE